MKRKKRKLPFLTHLVRFVVFCVFILVLIRAVQCIQLKKTLNQCKQEQSLLEQQKEDLEFKIEEANSDFFIEKKAREESDLAKPGDFVIKFKSQ